MNRLLKHDVNYLVRMIFILVSFFAFHGSVLAVSLSNENSGVDPYSPISETSTYDETESSVWAKVDHNLRVNWVESKNKVGVSGEVLVRESTVVARTSTKAVTSYYPKNGGALGKWPTEYLMPETKIDRFGSGFGKYFSPHGTPMNVRALPPGNTGAYNAFQVVKPFPVQSSTIVPAFNKIGLGTQYLSPVYMNTLLKRGIIVPLK